jgi:hypothetical protein
MEAAFPCVETGSSENQAPELPDPGDRHVVATALGAGADIIVTQNLKHFPRAILDPLGITPMNADDFLMMLYAAEPLAMADAIGQVVAQFRQPPVEYDLFLSALAVHTPQFCKKLAAHNTGPGTHS